jgi:hypothetical protein
VKPLLAAAWRTWTDPIINLGADALAARTGSPSTAVEPLWTIETVTKFLACSRRHIERERSAGRFPKPDLILGKRPRWKKETVMRWVDNVGRN